MSDDHPTEGPFPERFTVSEEEGLEGTFIEHPNGAWVKYADVEELIGRKIEIANRGYPMLRADWANGPPETYNRIDRRMTELLCQLADQCDKTQYWNAMHILADIQIEMLKRQQRIHAAKPKDAIVTSLGIPHPADYSGANVSATNARMNP